MRILTTKEQMNEIHNKAYSPMLRNMIGSINIALVKAIRGEGYEGTLKERVDCACQTQRDLWGKLCKWRLKMNEISKKEYDTLIDTLNKFKNVKD